MTSGIEAIKTFTTKLTTPPHANGLTCAARIETVNTVIHYLCGQQYYMLA
jgi:hypothetical protein